MKIYIAGPYTSTTPEGARRNVDTAIEAAVRLLKRGHFPFIPHLTHYVDEWTFGSEFLLQWEDYLAWDMVWLAQCDALFYLGSSRGADLERSFAEHLHKPIYVSIDDVPVGDGIGSLDPRAVSLLREAATA